MKKIIVLFTFFCPIINCAMATETIVLQGTYHGKNLYVQNPFAKNGEGFCVSEITVNDQVTTDKINSSAFEIDLGKLQLKTGDKIVVKINHYDGCSPKILNPEVIQENTFVTKNKPEEEQLSIFPNPVREDILNLKFSPSEYIVRKNSSMVNEMIHVEIIDIYGQVIERYNLIEYNSSISLNGLSTGNYFIRVYNEKINVLKKFSKM